VLDILKRELPALPIEVPAMGVGSREPFPTAGEDNAAVDRCVTIMVDLTSTTQKQRKIHRPPRKVYAPIRYWKLKVLTMEGVRAIGAKSTYLRIQLRNEVSGKAIVLSGVLFGGELTFPKLSNLVGVSNLSYSLPKDQVGDDVFFTTPEPMDFQDWIREGQMVRLLHEERSKRA